MGVASLVLGIVSMILAFIPLCNTIAFVPAVVGIILGIIELSAQKKKGQPIGMAIAGIILGGIAILITLIMIFLLAVLVSTSAV